MSHDGISWKTIFAAGGLYLAWRALTDPPPEPAPEVPEDIDWMDELVVWAYLNGGAESARRMMAMRAEAKEAEMKQWLQEQGLEPMEP
jgi:hypothetical protein